MIRKLLLTSVLLAILKVASYGQTAASYSFSAFSGTYTPVTGGTSVANILTDDAFSTGIPIGFNFKFCGVTYTTCAVSSNGFLSFFSGITGNYNTNDFPTLSSIAPAIMPLWDDLSGLASTSPAFTCGANYIMTGTPPNRVFTFDYNGYRWNYQSLTQDISFQIKLYETTNVVQIIYGVPAVTTLTNASATIGIAGSGTDYQSLPDASAAPVPSTTVFTTSIAAKPANNQVYQWTPPPPPTVTNNGPVCPRSSLVLTATTTIPNITGYTFFGPGLPATGTFVAAPANTLTIPNASSANAGTYTATVKWSSFTSDPGSTIVSVYPIPSIALGPVSATTTCLGNDGKIVITGLDTTKPFTLIYRQNGVSPGITSTFTSSAFGTDTIKNLTAGIYDSIRVVTSNGCVSLSLGPVVISGTVSIPSAPTATYTTPVCLGAPTALSIVSPVAGYVYSWSGPNGFYTSGTSTSVFIPSVAASNGGNYTITATNASGCVSTAGNVNLIISPQPAAPIPNNVTYCQFDQAVPVGGIGTGLIWYTTPTGGPGTTIPPTPSTLVAGTIIYYVSQTINCESPRAALTVTIKPHPAAPTLPGTNGLVTLCQYQLNYQVSATGSNLLWYPTPTGGLSMPTAPYVATTIPGTQHFYVTQTVNGCESDRSNLSVTVNPKPAPPTVVSPLRLCQFDAVNLTATGLSLLWYNTATGGAGIPSVSVNTGYVDSFKYYVTQTINTCESDRKLIQVYINVKPNGIIGASKTTLCQGETLDFYYYGNAADTFIYNWNSPQPAVQYVKGQGKGPYTLEFDSAGTQTVSVQVNNAGCLSAIANYDVVVKPQPFLSFSSQKQACLNEPITVALNGISPSIQKFDWNFDGATALFGAQDGGPFGIAYTTEGIHVVSVFATTKGCPSRLYTDTIVIHPVPDATIKGVSTDNGTLCTGDSVALSVENVEDQRYKWTPSQFFTEMNDSAASVIAKPFGKAYTYVKVTNKFNCVSQDSILINAQPCCGVFFATAFSPNHDGKNDYFFPITTGHHQVETFRVLNRWGQVVYESRNEGSKGWDGTFNGVPQDMGTYYYYYHYRCENGQYLEQKGEILLMR